MTKRDIVAAIISSIFTCITISAGSYLPDSWKQAYFNQGDQLKVSLPLKNADTTSQIGLACDEFACPNKPGTCLMSVYGTGKVFRCDKEIGDDDAIFALLKEALMDVKDINCSKAGK